MENKRLFLAMLLAIATPSPLLPMNEDISQEENRVLTREQLEELFGRQSVAADAKPHAGKKRKRVQTPKPKNFICSYPECGKACDRQSRLEAHMDNMHSGTHTCNNCAREFTSRSGYSSHVTRRMCFKPAVAAQLVVKKAKASAQEKQELLWEKSTCIECGHVCETPQGLSGHMQLKHSSIKGKITYECAVCFKTYTSSTKYKRHMICHDKPSSNKQQPAEQGSDCAVQ